MSKVPKDQIKEQKLKIKRRSDDRFAYRTVIISCFLGIITYSISLLFSFEIIPLFKNSNAIFIVLNTLIEVTIILLFFLFMMTSIGNFKELTGKPFSWKELLLLLILSLGQTLLNFLVFIFTCIGLFLIVIYFYLVQEP